MEGFDFALRVTPFAPVVLIETLFDVVDFPFLGCVFFLTTREERTDDFTAFCALLFSFVETFLFVFFNGDTDDLYCGGISIIWVARRNGHEYIESFNDLTEDAMLVVQVWGGTMGDEEL